MSCGGMNAAVGSVRSTTPQEDVLRCFTSHAQQRIFVTFRHEHKQSTAWFAVQGKISPTQLNLTFLIQNEAKDASLYSFTFIKGDYSANSRSNFTKQSDVISAMVFAPVKVIATRISLSINSKRFETPSPPAAPRA